MFSNNTVTQLLGGIVPADAHFMSKTDPTPSGARCGNGNHEASKRSRTPPPPAAIAGAAREHYGGERICHPKGCPATDTTYCMLYRCASGRSNPVAGSNLSVSGSGWSPLGDLGPSPRAARL